MTAQFKDDLARAGVPYEEYLKHIKKDEDSLRKEWRETSRAQIEDQGRMKMAKAAAKKAPARKAAKPAARKTTARKTTARKTTARKAAKR